MKSQTHITLREIPVGRRACIRHLRAEARVSTRLRELGFCENAVVRCVMKSHGNIICEVYNTRIGINNLLANEIFVTPFE